jgi:hypothetical protein
MTRMMTAAVAVTAFLGASVSARADHGVVVGLHVGFHSYECEAFDLTFADGSMHTYVILNGYNFDDSLTNAQMQWALVTASVGKTIGLTDSGRNATCTVDSAPGSNDITGDTFTQLTTPPYPDQ